MGKTTSRKEKIKDKADERISCYDQSRYSFNRIKATALAWYIQFAIRQDLVASETASVSSDSLKTQMSGLPQIFENRDKIRELIRSNPVIDEPALSTIGLTLYDFPTIAHFFVAPNKLGFVREATVRELFEEISYLQDRASEIDALRTPSEEFNPAEISVLKVVGEMTPTQVEAAAESAGGEISNERYFIVDMGAPVSVLKDQFLKMIARTKKQKLVAYEDWIGFGVLPYVDLKDWQQLKSERVLGEVVVSLLYGGKDDRGLKTLEETQRHAERLMNSKSPVSCDLRAEAVELFTQSVSFAREEVSLPRDEAVAAEEALDRWFPRSYPWNLPDIKRASLLHPDTAEVVQFIVQMMEGAAQSTSLRERIKTTASNEEGNGLIRVLRELNGEYRSRT